MQDAIRILVFFINEFKKILLINRLKLAYSADTYGSSDNKNSLEDFHQYIVS